ncbi:hypothetical protein [Serratia ureilytica]|uniref:hypothetical protein n=1 Tax=Serratia ureilytica TaxID=300181 RepID=UPI00398B97BF
MATKTSGVVQLCATILIEPVKHSRIAVNGELAGPTRVTKQGKSAPVMVPG